MTDEIAYKLGKFDFPSFYQIALWKVNQEPFELALFFDWSVPSMGWPCKMEKGEYVPDWNGITAGGRLKLDLIKDISHKLAYVRGRLSSYSVEIGKDRIYVGWANSYEFRDFFARCLQELIGDKFLFTGKALQTSDIPKYKVIKGETLGTIPGTPYVILEADEEVIKYIVGEAVVSPNPLNP